MTDAAPRSSNNSSRRGDSSRHQREIIVPDKHLLVKWHSLRAVRTYRIILQLFIFLAVLAFSFTMLPFFVAYLYPNIILPAARSLEWDCRPMHTYVKIDVEDLALETKLLASASAVNIKLFLDDKNTTFNDLEKIFLVVDDCTFDHYGKNVMLCQPSGNADYTPTFAHFVEMIEVCYHYIRQITRKAKITAYGKGIIGNALLAAAVRLRTDSCYQFDSLYLEDPIGNAREEIDRNLWSAMSFLLPILRENLINEAMHQSGLNEADLLSNANEIGKVPLYVVSENTADLTYSMLKPPAKVIGKKDFEQQINAQVRNVPIRGPFQFRHVLEEECAVLLKKSVTRLHIQY